MDVPLYLSFTEGRDGTIFAGSYGQSRLVAIDPKTRRAEDLGLMDAPAAVDWSAAPFPNPTGTTRANNLGVPFNFLFDLGQHGNVADPQKRYALRLSPQGAFEVGSNWRFEPRGYFATQIPDFVNDGDWRGKLVDSGGCFDPRIVFALRERLVGRQHHLYVLQMIAPQQFHELLESSLRPRFFPRPQRWPGPQPAKHALFLV